MSAPIAIPIATPTSVPGTPNALPRVPAPTAEVKIIEKAASFEADLLTLSTSAGPSPSPASTVFHCGPPINKIAAYEAYHAAMLDTLNSIPTALPQYREETYTPAPLCSANTVASSSQNSSARN